MSKINKILEYGLLSELAYLRLEDEWFKENNKYVNEGIGKYSYDEQGSLKNKENVIQFLNGKDIYGNIKINSKNKPLSKDDTDELTKIKDHRKDAMISLLDKYTIIDFTSDDGYFSSDFQAMLFKNNSTSKYVIAFRGTSSTKDGMVDAAIANIFGAHNYQENEAVAFIEDMKKKYGISDSNLILTGHSLGGILSQTLGVKLKIQAFAYNPLGTSSLIYGGSSFSYNMLVEVLSRFNIIDFSDDWVNENILTISYNDVGNLNGDILSNIATKANGSKHLGMKIDLFGSDVGLGAHGMSGLNELMEEQSEENLVTLADIMEYNDNEKTLFLDAIKQKKIDVLFSRVNAMKALFSVHTTQDIKKIITSSNKLIEKCNHENIDSLRINGRVEDLEDKSTFNHKLYYNFEENILKVKTKDFKEAADLSRLVIKENKNLKKYDVIIEIEGEE